MQRICGARAKPPHSQGDFWFANQVFWVQLTCCDHQEGARGVGCSWAEESLAFRRRPAVVVVVGTRTAATRSHQLCLSQARECVRTRQRQRLACGCACSVSGLSWRVLCLLCQPAPSWLLLPLRRFRFFPSTCCGLSECERRAGVTETVAAQCCKSVWLGEAPPQTAHARGHGGVRAAPALSGGAPRARLTRGAACTSAIDTSCPTWRRCT